MISTESGIRTRLDDMSSAYVNFIQVVGKGENRVWSVRTKGRVRIGEIRWHPGCRVYAFYPNCDTIGGVLLTTVPLADISRFLAARMREIHQRKEAGLPVDPPYSARFHPEAP